MSAHQDIAKALGGKSHGSYSMAPCPCHADGKTPALKISDCQHHDDGIDVVCFAGCDWRTIKDELKRRGLLSGTAAEGQGVATAFNAEQRAKDIERVHGVVRDIWKQCRPAAGTPVERYLSEVRCIDLKALVWIPPSIRFHPALRHSPTGLDLPCMVSAVQAPDRRIIGLHRTWLTEQGKKAPFGQNRMMLGQCGGGAVRLAAAPSSVMLAEGIETALAAMQIFKRSAWAALSTGGLRTIILPAEIKTVFIAADGDAPGIEAAHAAAERFESEGRTVRIETPSSPAKDWNDVVIAKSGAA
jgi:hypothetical protein